MFAWRLGRGRNKNVVCPLFARQETIDHIWCCIDYNRMRFRDGRTGLAIAAAELTPELWSATDRALAESLETFWLLGPPGGPGKLFHFIGRHRGGAWRPRQFRSLTFGTWYPTTRELISVRSRLTLEDRLTADGGWRFEPSPRPRLVDAAGESLALSDPNDPWINPNATYQFCYDDKLGRHTIPVTKRLLAHFEPMPRVWRVDCRAPCEIHPGSARSRGHPARAGTARLSETEWAQLEQTLTDALLHWPRTEATGHRPLWVEFDRGYHEGVWGTLLITVGSDNAVTGPPDFAE
jgi:hypothetical protein